MNCHLCETPLESAIVVNTVARYGEPQTSVACSKCGLVQVTPLPSETELQGYYREEYRKKFPWNPVQDADGRVHEHGSPEYEALFDKASVLYAKQIFAALGEVPGTVWEFGCGEGRLCAAMQSLGANVIGIDPDPSMRVAAYARGVEAHECPPEFIYDLPDAIVSVHSLEHMRNPLESLDDMRRGINGDGHLWIEVPNTNRPYGPLSHYFQTPHLWNFTPDTLALLVLRAGFDDVRVAESNSVIFCHARERSGRPRDYETAVAQFGSVPPDGLAVAAMLAEYTRRRESSPGARLGAWLEARGADDLDWLRDEFELTADTLMLAINSLGRMSEDLDAFITRDEWSAEPWVLGHICGQKEMAQRTQVAAIHLANSLTARGTR